MRNPTAARRTTSPLRLAEEVLSLYHSSEYLGDPQDLQAPGIGEKRDTLRPGALQHKAFVARGKRVIGRKIFKRCQSITTELPLQRGGTRDATSSYRNPSSTSPWIDTNIRRQTTNVLLSNSVTSSGPGHDRSELHALAFIEYDRVSYLQPPHATYQSSNALHSNTSNTHIQSTTSLIPFTELAEMQKVVAWQGLDG
nr:hypothetical protein Iba_chr10bCG5640 [Ipomoea batatas]